MVKTVEIEYVPKTTMYCLLVFCLMYVTLFINYFASMASLSLFIQGVSVDITTRSLAFKNYKKVRIIPLQLTCRILLTEFQAVSVDVQFLDRACVSWHPSLSQNTDRNIVSPVFTGSY